MRLVMMGTGDFAVPTLRELLKRGHCVALLVTQPDRPQGRHQELVPAPIKQLALDRGLAVFQPQNVNDPDSIRSIADAAPDLLVVAAYGQILSPDLLSVARYGGVNLHGSLLPKYRGAAPVNWAIYHGETYTGVTVIHMTPRIDAGDILSRAVTPIGVTERADVVELRLAEIGAPLISDAVEGLRSGTWHGQPQDRSQVSRAPKLKKEHGLVDWTRTARQICDHLRAMHPWPGTYTFLKQPDGRALRLALVQIAPVDTTAPAQSTRVDTSVPAQAKPGTIIRVDASTLHVAASNGAIAIEQLRPAGKRTMSIAEFLRGHACQLGAELAGSY